MEQTVLLPNPTHFLHFWAAAGKQHRNFLNNIEKLQCLLMGKLSPTLCINCHWTTFSSALVRKTDQNHSWEKSAAHILSEIKQHLCDLLFLKPPLEEKDKSLIRKASFLWAFTAFSRAHCL